MMTFWTSQAINGFQPFPNYSFLEWTKLIKTISVCGSQRFFLPSFLASCMEQNVWQKKWVAMVAPENGSVQKIYRIAKTPSTDDKSVFTMSKLQFWGLSTNPNESETKHGVEHSATCSLPRRRRHSKNYGKQFTLPSGNQALLPGKSSILLGKFPM